MGRCGASRFVLSSRLSSHFSCSDSQVRSIPVAPSCHGGVSWESSSQPRSRYCTKNDGSSTDRLLVWGLLGTAASHVAQVIPLVEGCRSQGSFSFVWPCAVRKLKLLRGAGQSHGARSGTAGLLGTRTKKNDEDEVLNNHPLAWYQPSNERRRRRRRERGPTVHGGTRETFQIKDTLRSSSRPSTLNIVHRAFGSHVRPFFTLRSGSCSSQE
jgi:hypothetical protein